MEAKLEWLDDPRIFRVGKLLAHSDHDVYRNEKEYKTGNQADTVSLDGEWDFHYGESPRERTEMFYDPQSVSARAQFDKILVPGTSNYKDMVKFSTLTHCILGTGNNSVVRRLWMVIQWECQAFLVTHRIIQLVNMLKSLIYQRILKSAGCISRLTVWNRRCICG